MEPTVYPRKLSDGREVYDVRYRNDQGEHKSLTKYSLDEANALASDIRYGRDNEDLVPTTTLGAFFQIPEVAEAIRNERDLSEKTCEGWRLMWKNQSASASMESPERP